MAAEGSTGGIRMVMKNVHDKIPEYYETELEIHDYPPQRRWRVTQRETLVAIKENTGIHSIATEGNYIAPGEQPKPGKKKLYMLLKGPTEDSVKNAQAELLRVLEEDEEEDEEGDEEEDEEEDEENVGA